MPAKKVPTKPAPKKEAPGKKPASAKKVAAKKKPAVAKEAAPTQAEVSIFGLEKEYVNLHRVYMELLRRDLSVLEDMGQGEPPADISTCTKINFVDFAAALTPIPEGIPLETNSDANKFLMLVCKMLDACESGSIGGDACRMTSVVLAATDDALDVRPNGKRFHHLLGLTAAISNHGMESWFQRGDPDSGDYVFKELGDAWKKMLKLPEEQLAAEGVSQELRKFAVQSCQGLQKYLKHFGSKEYQGMDFSVFKFNFGRA
jgi:hypothetical protein